MSQPNVLELVAQLASLQRTLKPHLPAISQKLIGDLLSTGHPAATLARVIGRSPSYVKAIAGGEKSLSAEQIVKVAQHAAESMKNAKD